VLPIKNLQPDKIIEDGGHLINMTYADTVNAFISECLARHQDEQAGPGTS
jgi:hypothetical protein